MSFLENKIPPPLLALTCAPVMWVVAQWFPDFFMFPFVLKFILITTFCFCAAYLLMASALRFRKAKTTVNPLKPETTSALVTSGVYRFTRNPMYLAMVLLLCAWGMYLGNLWVFAFVFLYGAYLDRFQIQPEERALAALFGEEFSAYKRNVGRWL